MTLVLRLINSPNPFDDGRFLKSYDPDAMKGRGFIVTTDDPQKAMTFDDARAALELWQTQSTVVPLRHDGKPNRPLTAFTVEVLPLEVALTDRRHS